MHIDDAWEHVLTRNIDHLASACARQAIGNDDDLLAPHGDVRPPHALAGDDNAVGYD